MLLLGAIVREPFAAQAVVKTPTRDRRLELMVEEHFDFIGRLLRRMGTPPSELEDATQQVFLVAAGRVDDICPGKERSFLFGTAVRVATTARRHRMRERPG